MEKPIERGEMKNKFEYKRCSFFYCVGFFPKSKLNTLLKYKLKLQQKL